jgi:hypothetical protein
LIKNDESKMIAQKKTSRESQQAIAARLKSNQVTDGT